MPIIVPVPHATHGKCGQRFHSLHRCNEQISRPLAEVSGLLSSEFRSTLISQLSVSGSATCARFGVSTGRHILTPVCDTHGLEAWVLAAWGGRQQRRATTETFVAV